MNHYPLVCDPALLDGAEARVRAFPHLSYGWAIKFADVPMKHAAPAGARLTRQMQQADRLEYLQHRNRTQHARRGGRRD